MNKIGQLNEQPLHNALKHAYAGEIGQLEVRLEGYVIDVVLGEQLVEIQTGNFSAIRRKMQRLVKDHFVKLIYPVAAEKWLLKNPRPGEGATQTRRKSPKRGRVVEIFNELVSFPELMQDSHFSLEVALTQEEEVREYQGDKRWRQHGWRTVERRLLAVLDRRTFDTPADLARLLPANLPPTFTTADLAEGMAISRHLAQKAAYCYRKMAVIQSVGKRSRSNLYTFGENYQALED